MVVCSRRDKVCYGTSIMLNLCKLIFDSDEEVMVVGYAHGSKRTLHIFSIPKYLYCEILAIESY
jgi:hypothetical protein